jgi:hypothetical protein
MHRQPQEPSDLTSSQRATLPSLVRSQLRRRRRASRGDGRVSAEEIEERVREALYGKTYYDGTHRRVYTELEGHHAA